MTETGAVLAILERAMAIEEIGYNFYQRAVRVAQDTRTKDVFSTLAEDEHKHHDLIKRQYDSLSEGGEWLASDNIEPVAINLDQPLFPQSKQALENIVNPEVSEREALLFGLDIEIKSYDLYRKATSETGADLGRQVFEFLAAQEMGHANTLMMRYDAVYGPTSWQS